MHDSMGHQQHHEVGTMEELMSRERLIASSVYLSGTDEDGENSLAVNSLKELVSSRKLKADEAEKLKTAFIGLYSHLRTAYRRERETIKMVKSMHNEQLAELIRQEKAQNSLIETVANLERLEAEKEQLAAKVVQLEHSDTMLRYEVGELHNVRQDLTDQFEDQRIENEHLVRPELDRLKDLQAASHAELERLVEAQRRDLECKDTVTARLEGLAAQKKELDHALASAKMMQVKLRAEPDRMAKQAESMEKAVHSVKLEMDRLEGRTKQLEAELGRMDAARAEGEELQHALSAKLDLHRETIVHRQKDVEAVGKRMEQEQARHHELITRKLEVELIRREADEAARREADALGMARKELDALKRRLKRKRSIAAAARDVAPALKQQLEDAKVELNLANIANKEITKQTEELSKEVDLGIAKLLTQEGVENSKRENLRVLVETVEGLEADILLWAGEESKQQRLLGLLQAQREVKAMEAMRAAEAEREARERVKVKQLAVLDLTKRCTDVDNRLREFGALYDVVKNERNKYVNLIQASNQALAEMKEKIKILQNEVDILRNESTAKDKALQKEHAAHSQSQMQRDALRLDAIKASQEYSAKQAELERQITEIEKLNTIINSLERDMLRLKGLYEGAVEGRNLAGVQLIDRNDELCVLYEKANLQEQRLMAGEPAIRAKEDDLRMLKLQASELSWRLETSRKKFPELPARAARISQLQAQLAEERALTEQLGRDLEDPENTARWRALPGTDPDSTQLAARIAVLEARLSEKKEQLLEKELVLEEVTVLTSTLKERAGEGRAGTAVLARRVNEFHGKIQTTTRRMMATVSELSMYQATALRLQQEKVRRLAEVTEGQRRMAQGEPPTEEAWRDWQRRLRALESQEVLNIQAAEKLSSGPIPPPGAVRTTAEIRPNAYIPDELGIPKPYGGLAPFKPQEPGSTMRHIRIPNPPEIEI